MTVRGGPGAGGVRDATRSRPRPRRRPRRGAGRGDAGTVTAELAVGLVAVVLVLATVLLAASASARHVRCLDAARAGARVAALGEPDATVVAVALRVAPGSSVAVRRDPPWVEVVVRDALAGGWLAAEGFALSGRAVAWSEP